MKKWKKIGNKTRFFVFGVIYWPCPWFFENETEFKKVLFEPWTKLLTESKLWKSRTSVNVIDISLIVYVRMYKTRLKIVTKSQGQHNRY